MLPVSLITGRNLTNFFYRTIEFAEINKIIKCYIFMKTIML